MVMCIFLFLLWLILNGKVTLEICLFGVVITGAVYAFCVAALGCRPQTERRFLKRLGGYVVYGAIRVREIIRANLAVMRVIWSRKPDYHPAIVRVHAPLEKPVSRMLLSNSITLTPGTVTVRQEGEDYLVLCLNKAHAADIPDWSLTRLLRKMEGPEWN